MSAPAQGPTVPSVLLPEILQFSPQLLLDDIINFANEAITNAADGLEEFLFRWATDREQRVNEDWDSTQEVEQGLVAFQTLLEYHTDIALTSSKPDGLDLTYPPERESELMSEIDELRKKIDAQRRLKRLLTRAVRTSAAQANRSERLQNQLSFLQSPQLRELSQVPDQFEKMFSSVSSLPALTPESTAALTQLPLVDPGKQPWETSKSAYFDWATKQVLAKVKKQISGTGDTTIASLAKITDAIAKSRDMVETSAELLKLQGRGA
ncbi:Mis12-domain-containing protein [Boletus reticuloceps]|uniref:Mis12-domain-containing protein n=1 Tax=Boletus reticuloceps TaxID=495285 RepID=A0A8I2YV64_9AGAM|nr:Mis12-domain-containing protein [Boletus reticuloceps]